MFLNFVMPLFDSIQYVNSSNSRVNQHITHVTINDINDASLLFEHANDWLLEQRNHENNYKAYRSELTTFLHWCFDVNKISVTLLTRKEIAKYVDYCQHPPIELIGYFNVSQFKTDKLTGERYPNENWRLFVGKKIAGIIQPYKLSDNALKTKIAILSSFYSYLMGEDYCEKNPAQVWMNHSRFATKAKYQHVQNDEVLAAFTELQWSYVMESAALLAAENPQKYQRSLFLIRLLYGCYLRISDVAARAGYSPIMSQFRQNLQTGSWTFYLPQSKGGKRRSVAVSKPLLEGLKEYRLFLGISELPSIDENIPLFVRHKAAGRGRDLGELNANLGIRHLRDEVEFVIKHGAQRAFDDGLYTDAKIMETFTAHNIRHTGITHDININHRPLSHVQADAGHDSIDTTSRYLHTSESERFESAVNKSLNNLQGI